MVQYLLPFLIEVHSFKALYGVDPNLGVLPRNIHDTSSGVVLTLQQR
jgi:hypothetical protein